MNKVGGFKHYISTKEVLEVFKTKVGYSTNLDAALSAEEAASKIVSVGNVKLAMVYPSHDMNLEKVIEGAKSVLRNKPLIGCTMESIIVPEGIVDDSFVGMYGFSEDDMIVGVACSEAGKEPREIGKKIAREAITNAGIKKVPSYFYMVASPSDEEEYLKGIEDVIGTVPFFGGSAPQNEDGTCRIICNDKVINDGCAVAFFFAKNECKNMYSGYFRETSNVGVITRLNGYRNLAEIDKTPALVKYAEWNNVDSSSILDKEIQKISVLNPLGVKDPLGNLTAVRMPIIGNKDNSISVTNNLATGTAVIGLHITEEEIIKSVSSALVTLNNKMKKEPSGYFLIHSLDRKNVLGERKEQIYREIKNVLGSREFMMIFSSNEYGSNDHSASTCGSLTLSFTGFSE